MRTCVVVYSNAGKALAYADELAQNWQAEVLRIEPRIDFKGFMKYVYWGYKASFKRSVFLKPDKFDLKDVDQFIVVAPIHANRVCAPVRSWLFTHRSYLKNVSIVVTHLDKEKDYRDAVEALEKEMLFKFTEIQSKVIE
jgi:hypothetical protein